MNTFQILDRVLMIAVEICPHDVRRGFDSEELRLCKTQIKGGVHLIANNKNMAIKKTFHDNMIVN